MRVHSPLPGLPFDPAPRQFPEQLCCQVGSPVNAADSAADLHPDQAVTFHLEGPVDDDGAQLQERQHGR
jgi:hypothetical protein